jgi:hypothetical protein
MAERRAPRFALEVLFLAALAAALTFANLRPLAIAGLMLLGWVFVAIFEWGALRSRAHYGSGLPPRWYVPELSLPPPRPLEQVGAGYPAAEVAGDAPTWIASPAMLADWPVAEIEPSVDEQTQVHDVLEVELAIAVAEAREESAEAVAEPEPAEAPRREERAVVSEETQSLRMARHRIDPLEEPAPKARRFGKRQSADVVYAEVPARPTGSRPLPTLLRGDD